MKKLLFFFALLAISYSVSGETISYLPANPLIVGYQVITLQNLANKNRLVEIRGICQPITTRVHKEGNRVYHEPVRISSYVNLGMIKVINYSDDTSQIFSKKVDELAIKSFLKPGTWQSIVIRGEISANHPVKYGWLKKQFKRPVIILNGCYQDKQLAWKGHNVTIYQTETDWILISALIIFILLLPVPILMDTYRFKNWLKKKYSGNTIDNLTIWFGVTLAISLIVLFFCQVFVLLICVALICASFFHKLISESIEHYWSTIFRRRKKIK